MATPDQDFRGPRTVSLRACLIAGLLAVAPVAAGATTAAPDRAHGIESAGPRSSRAAAASSGVRAVVPRRVAENREAERADSARDESLAPAQAVLFEEKPPPQGSSHAGSAIWRTETTGSGQLRELVVRADIDVPDRHLHVTLSWRRDADPHGAVNRLVDMRFDLPADFPFGGIASISGLLVKDAAQARGTPLAGRAVRVAPNVFLYGLAAGQRNLDLVRQHAWFSIAIVYNDGMRSILAVEKGASGSRAFDAASTAWGDGSGAAAAPGQSADANAAQGPAPAAGSERSSAGGMSQSPGWVFLSEESDAGGMLTHTGWVRWRTGPALPAEGPAIHADIEIPERHFKMAMIFKRNPDQVPAASHTFELSFDLPADFVPPGGVASVSGVLMKTGQNQRGVALYGIPLKSSSGPFVFGLSPAESDVQRNIALLKEKSWLQVPIVYRNGRRASLTIEKGTLGERTFKDAFASWGQ